MEILQDLANFHEYFYKNSRTNCYFLLEENEQTDLKTMTNQINTY